MDPWLRLRFLEDRKCPSYKQCHTATAIRNVTKHVPCYECMGGIKMPQIFHCFFCRTVWTETDNNWVVMKEVTCPFCIRRQSVKIEMKGGQLVGTIISNEPTHDKETN